MWCNYFVSACSPCRPVPCPYSELQAVRSVGSTSPACRIHFVDFALCRWAPSSRVVTLLQLESRGTEVYIIVMCNMWEERSGSCGMWVIHYSAQYLTARRIDPSPQSNSQLTVSVEKQTNFHGSVRPHGVTCFCVVKFTSSHFCRFVQTQMKPVYVYDSKVCGMCGVREWMLTELICLKCTNLICIMIFGLFVDVNI